MASEPWDENKESWESYMERTTPKGFTTPGGVDGQPDEAHKIMWDVPIRSNPVAYKTGTVKERSAGEQFFRGFLIGLSLTTLFWVLFGTGLWWILK